MASGQLLPQRMRRLDRYFSGALGLYLVAGILLIGQFRYQINPDALSYISIAQHYRDGLWQEAINAYWSPLYSWLFLPLLFFKLDPLLAAKVLNLLLGLAVLVGSWRLSLVLALSAFFRRVFIFALIPLVLYWAFSVISPDLLSIALLIPFLTLVLRPDFLRRPLLCLLAGFYGGLGYLSKAYALPFVLAVFAVCALWQTLSLHRSVKNLLRGSGVFLASLAAVASPWAMVISHAYQRFTLGTAGRFNFALIGPNSFWYPTLTLGLFGPPNEHALSAWEDPSLLPQRLWSPFSSGANFTFWLGKIVSNIGDFCQMLNSFSILALPAIGAALYLTIRQMRGEHRAYDPTLALVLSIFILAGGYTLVFLEQRYIWMCAIGIFLAGLVAIQFGCPSSRAGKALAWALTPALALSFVVAPAGWLRDHRGIDREFREAALTLPEMNGSHFASNDETSLYYAYYKNAKFYGLPQGDPNRIARQFKEFRIDRYFLIGTGIRTPRFVDEADRLDSGKISNLRLYRVRPAGGDQ